MWALKRKALAGARKGEALPIGLANGLAWAGREGHNKKSNSRKKGKRESKDPSFVGT
jgi:hypothetical protein